MAEHSDPADRGYAICTSGRSGSNLLCQYLSSTGVLGNPLEYFNGSGRRLLGYPEYPDEPSRQIDWILTAGATPNGIYGLKVFPARYCGPKCRNSAMPEQALRTAAAFSSSLASSTMMR
jgi:LPS sulfotransferase NodH